MVLVSLLSVLIAAISVFPLQATPHPTSLVLRNDADDEPTHDQYVLNSGDQNSPTGLFLEWSDSTWRDISIQYDANSDENLHILLGSTGVSLKRIPLSVLTNANVNPYNPKMTPSELIDKPAFQDNIGQPVFSDGSCSSSPDDADVADAAASLSSSGEIFLTLSSVKFYTNILKGPNRLRLNRAIEQLYDSYTHAPVWTTGYAQLPTNFYMEITSPDNGETKKYQIWLDDNSPSVICKFSGVKPSNPGNVCQWVDKRPKTKKLLIKSLTDFDSSYRNGPGKL